MVDALATSYVEGDTPLDECQLLLGLKKRDATERAMKRRLEAMESFYSEDATHEVFRPELDSLRLHAAELVRINGELV